MYYVVGEFEFEYSSPQVTKKSQRYPRGVTSDEDTVVCTDMGCKYTAIMRPTVHTEVCDRLGRGIAITAGLPGQVRGISRARPRGIVRSDPTICMSQLRF